MGVDHAERRRLGAQIMQDAAKHRMLEHVGEIAGMEGVAIIHELARACGDCRRRHRTAIIAMPAHELMPITVDRFNRGMPRRPKWLRGLTVRSG